MDDYRDNIEIDLKDLAKKILSRWKILILVMVLGAAVGGAYGYANRGEEDNEQVTDMAALEAALSDKEIMEVKNAVDIYTDYKKIHDETETYQNNSILMSINTNQTPIARTMYLISDYEEDDVYLTDLSVVDNIVALYQNMLYEDDVAGSVVASVESVVNREYAKELYSVNKTGKSMLVLQAMGTNKQQAEAILDTVSDKLVEKSTTVRRFIPHSITEVSKTYQSIYDASITSRKQNLISSLDSLNKSMIAVPSSLTAAQKSYYTALLEEKDINFGIERQEVVQEGFGSIIKYSGLGAVGLAFLLVFVIAIKYIMSPAIRTTDDLRCAFGLPVLGCIKSGSHDELEMLSYSIAAGAKKEDVDKICFIGAAEGAAVEEKKSQIIALMSDKNISALSASDILGNTGSVEKVTESKGVVLFEKIGASAFDDIARELELCKNCGVKVIGTVVLQ